MTDVDQAIERLRLLVDDIETTAGALEKAEERIESALTYVARAAPESGEADKRDWAVVYAILNGTVVF